MILFLRVLGGLLIRLKVLPPTLRKNNRYLVLDIKVSCPISKDNLVGIVWDGCVRFHGECNTSNFNLWVMRFFVLEKFDDFYHYKAIVMCQRGFVNEVRSAIALVNRYNGKSISMTIIALSGTIKSAQKFI